jgi:hypothetical protein
LLLRWGLWLAAPAQPGTTRHLRALLGVGRRDDRVVGLEVEGLAIARRAQIVGDGKVPPQRLQLLAADQADEMVPLHGAADAHRRLGLRRLLRLATETTQLPGDGGDENRHLDRRHGMVAEVGGDDLGGQARERRLVVVVAHHLASGAREDLQL